MAVKKLILIGLCSLVLSAALGWKPALATQGIRFPARPGTYAVGKQGLSVINPPKGATFVYVHRIKPPLKTRFVRGIDMAYRGPILDITFVNNQGSQVKSKTLSHVYFNISEAELKAWNERGTDGIAIWYNAGNKNIWQMCHTVLVEEKINNGQYDRLACVVMGNGMYLLGKMEIDKRFPELFKLYNHDELRSMNESQMHIHLK